MYQFTLKDLSTGDVIKDFTGDAEDVGLIGRAAIDKVSPRKRPGRQPALAASPE